MKTTPKGSQGMAFFGVVVGLLEGVCHWECEVSDAQAMFSGSLSLPDV